MDLNAAVDIVQKTGFPIVVALWLMLRTDRKLDKVIDLIMLSNGRHCHRNDEDGE